MKQEASHTTQTQTQELMTQRYTTLKCGGIHLARQMFGAPAPLVSTGTETFRSIQERLSDLIGPVTWGTYGIVYRVLQPLLETHCFWGTPWAEAPRLLDVLRATVRSNEPLWNRLSRTNWCTACRCKEEPSFCRSRFLGSTSWTTSWLGVTGIHRVSTE